MKVECLIVLRNKFIMDESFQVSKILRLCFWFWRLDFPIGESGICFCVVQQNSRLITSHYYFRDVSRFIMKVKVKEVKLSPCLNN
jgi:hypothetical protein